MALIGWNSNKRLILTIPQRSTVLTDFPLLINLTAASGANHFDCSAVFNEVGTSRYKIAVEDGNSGQQCFVEIERWDAANLNAQLWCKVPSVSASGDTVLHLYYDATHADNTDQVGDIGSTPGRTVWSNQYVAVYHLSQDPSTTVKDSTSNARNLTPYGSMTLSQLVDGPTGKATSFDGSNDYMETVAGDLSAMQAAFTVECVAKGLGGGGWVPFLLIGSITSGSIYLQRYSSTGYLNCGVGDDNAQSGVAITTTAYKHYGLIFASGTIKCIGNGVIDSISNAVTPENLSNDKIGIDRNGAYSTKTVRSIRVSKIARSSVWLAASYGSDFDQLVSYSYPLFTLTAAFVQSYDLEAVYVLRMVEQLYHLPYWIMQPLEQIYGIKTAAAFVQYYGDAARVLQRFEQYYGDAALVRRAYAQLYSDAIAVRNIIEKPYSLPVNLRRAIEQHYAISAGKITRTLDQQWDIKDTDMASAFFSQPFGLLGDAGRILTTTVSVQVGATVFEPLHVSVEGSRDQYCLSAEVVCGTQAEYLACIDGADLVITIDDDVFHLFVESRHRNRSHGSAEYTVQGLSKTARLDTPYADTITGELSGMASAIVAELAAGFSVDWRTVDWFIPPSTLLPSAETPLTIIRNIAQAAGAIVQTAPDGALIIEPDYPVSVACWQTAPIDVHLSESLDFFTVTEEFGHRPGYNKYLISDQMTTQETSKIEEEAVSETAKYIRGYRTPWLDDCTLRHTGGGWVAIEPLGVEEVAKTEVVEFVAGESKTAYPIYSIVSVSWLQTNLGSVTPAEDGRLSSAVEGESLLSITYRTKCAKWRVINLQSEKVQFILEEPSEVTV